MLDTWNIQDAVYKSFRAISRNKAMYFLAFLFPLLVGVLPHIVGTFTLPTRVRPWLAPMLRGGTALIAIYFTAAFSIFLARIACLESPKSLWKVFRPTKRTWLYLLAQIFLLAILLSLVLTILAAAKIFSASPEGPSHRVIFPVAAMLIVVIFYIFVRVSFIFPAIAMERDLSIKNLRRWFWTETKGCFWRIAWTILIFSALQILFVLLLIWGEGQLKGLVGNVPVQDMAISLVVSIFRSGILVFFQSLITLSITLYYFSLPSRRARQRGSV